MRSIRTKILYFVIGCLLFSSIAVGGAGVLVSQRLLESESVQKMNLLCEIQAEEADAILSEIEISVDTVASYARSQLRDIQRFKENGLYRKNYTEGLYSVALNAANNTMGAVAFYIRYNPDLSDSTAGFWSVKTDDVKQFERRNPVDLSIYSPADTGYTEWYYVPANEKKPIWLPPYYNRNVGMNMISYVVPYYADGVLVGVVGMDINIEILRGLVRDVNAYDSGYAFLVTKQEELVSHRECPDFTSIYDQYDAEFADTLASVTSRDSKGKLYAYQVDDIDKRATIRVLRNGMKMIVTAPYSEINQPTESLIGHIIIIAAVIVLLASVMSIMITNRLTEPLLELNDAAKRFADGDLDVEIKHHSGDEIGTLSESVRQMAESLRCYIGHINSLAYRDAMTGCKNKAAYLERIECIESSMDKTAECFAVAVFDLNNLKYVNDNYGHELGDLLIKSACKIICQVFKHSPVFRIGGDEFVVILQDCDYEQYEQLMILFDQLVTTAEIEAPKGVTISVAKGVAVFNPIIDNSYHDVFTRADILMYEEKRRTKGSD